MSGDLTDARAALAELTRCSYSHGLNALIERCRPLLEPSDAERKLDDAIIDPPPRVPQVGDTVRLPEGYSKRSTVEVWGVRGAIVWFDDGTEDGDTIEARHVEVDE